MKSPEIKVGQKYRVVDVEAFGYTEVCNGDILNVIEIDRAGQGMTSEGLLVAPFEIAHGTVELIEDAREPTEASDDVSAPPHGYAPEEAEDVSQGRTEDSTTIRSGHSAELLWKFIEASPDYNGHKQFEVDEITFECLKEVVVSLGRHLECDPDVVASTLEIRLMYNGNLGGKYSGTWGASVYQLDYWNSDEHLLGHRDRLLFGVEIVKGI